MLKFIQNILHALISSSPKVPVDDSKKIYSINNGNVAESTFAQTFKKEDLEKALERAWKNRDFEIEMYWKRASYFWTFIGAAFAGYFALIGSKGYHELLKPQFYHVEALIITIGLIFSMAWYYVNQGSKAWQVNWEKQIDELENLIGRPNYSTIFFSRKRKSFSVSKINKQVSLYVRYIWLILLVAYCIRFYDRYIPGTPVDWTKTLLNGLSILLLIVSYVFYRFLKRKSISGSYRTGKEISDKIYDKEFFFGRIKE